MSAISDILKDIRLPRMVRVHQQFDSQVVEDIPGEITRQLSGDFPHGIKAGMSVAITCGSRGIANLSTIMPRLPSSIFLRCSTLMLSITANRSCVRWCSLRSFLMRPPN